MSDEHPGLPKPAVKPDRIVLEPGQVVRLELAIGRLRTRDREIFLSARRDGLTYASIARQHRCSVANVQKVIARVLITLHRSVWPD